MDDRKIVHLKPPPPAGEPYGILLERADGRASLVRCSPDEATRVASDLRKGVVAITVRNAEGALSVFNTRYVVAIQLLDQKQYEATETEWKQRAAMMSAVASGAIKLPGQP